MSNGSSRVDIGSLRAERRILSRPDLHQPAWVKYDSRLALHFSVWTAALIGNNLTNVAVCDQAASRPLGGAGETSCWLDRGRELRLEVSAQLQGN